MNCEQTAKPLHPLDRSMYIIPFPEYKHEKAPKNHRSQVLFFMPPTGGRTRTLSPERDFKSLVSANFTTAAHRYPAYKALLPHIAVGSRE